MPTRFLPLYDGVLTADGAREVQALEQDAKPPPTVRIEGLLLASRKADGPVDIHPQAVGNATTTAAAAGLHWEVSFMKTPLFFIDCSALRSGALQLACGAVDRSLHPNVKTPQNILSKPIEKRPTSDDPTIL